MIIEKKVKNYTVFVKKDGEKYIEIFKDFLSYNHQVIKVFRNIEDTKVVLINTDYGKYILKVFSPKVKNTERFFGNDSNLLIVFYVQIMPDDFVMQLHRF